MAMMISWVAPVNPSHPYLENDPAPSFDRNICAFHLGFSLVPFPDGLVDTGKSPPTPDSRLRGNDGQVKRVSGIRHIQVETVLVVVSGWSLLNTVQAVTLILAPRFARVARDEVLTLKFSGLGATTAAHWFNVLMVLLTLHIGLAILIEATLSFLGAGLPPPIPSLGSMDVNRVSAWWIFFSPAWRL